MIDPQDLVGEIVAALQGIPAVLVLMESDSDRIAGYVDDQNSGLLHRSTGMAWPSILVAYQGTESASLSTESGDGAEVWRHRFSIYARPPHATAFATLAAAVINGVPAGQSRKFLDFEFIATGTAMNTPTISRTFDEEGGEHPEISFTVDDGNWE